MIQVRAGIVLLLLAWACAALAAGVSQLQGKIEAINPKFGNIDTSLTSADLKKLGLQRGDSFKLAVNGKRVDIYLGYTYSDVPKGDWVAFITKGDKLRIARNLANAAKTLGAKIGDSVTLYH